MKRVIAIAVLVALLAAPVMAARRSSTEPTPPPSFPSQLATFISYADDVTALRSWYETLSPAEQEANAATFQAAVDKLAAMEDGLATATFAQLDEGCCDSNLYLVYDTVKGMDPIKARKVFASLINKVSKRVNADYLANPSNPDMARRARDMQAVRAYIGHNG